MFHDERLCINCHPDLESVSAYVSLAIWGIRTSLERTGRFIKSCLGIHLPSTWRFIFFNQTSNFQPEDLRIRNTSREGLSKHNEISPHTFQKGLSPCKRTPTLCFLDPMLASTQNAKLCFMKRKQRFGWRLAITTVKWFKPSGQGVWVGPRSLESA